MLKFIASMHNRIADATRMDDRGATAVEYGLIVALIAGVIITIVGLLGGRLTTMFTNVYNALP